MYIYKSTYSRLFKLYTVYIYIYICIYMYTILLHIRHKIMIYHNYMTYMKQVISSLYSLIDSNDSKPEL